MFLLAAAIALTGYFYLFSLMAVTAALAFLGRRRDTRRLVPDLTERRRAEAALRASETRYRRLFETAQDGILLLDADTGQITDVNPYLMEMLGYAHAAFLGKRLWEIGPFKNIAAARLSFLELQRTGYVRHEDLPLQTSEGRIKEVEFVSNAYAAGARQVIQCNIRDITERKRAESALQASLQEKTVLLKEIHHRVKNNLQMVISLLNLQAARLENPEMLDTLRVTRNRVHAMALLHESLYSSANLARIRFADFAKQLCAHLFQSAGSPAARIALQLQILEVELGLDQAVPCGLIINELVCNSLKHAFPKDRPGQITVAVQARDDQQVRLTVADDGVGLPPGLDLHNTGTLGLELVSALTTQLKGQLEVERHAGTTFRITFQANSNGHAATRPPVNASTIP
jgi:PAS domain S-box-containing protein